MELKYLETFLGPNRRSDRTWVEVMLEFTEAELGLITEAQEEVSAGINSILRDLGCPQETAGGAGRSRWIDTGFAWEVLSRDADSTPHSGTIPPWT